MPTFLFIYTNPSDPSIYEANIYLFFRYTKAFEKIIFLSVYTNNYHQINISHLFSINIFVFFIICWNYTNMKLQLKINIKKISLAQFTTKISYHKVVKKKNICFHKYYILFQAASNKLSIFKLFYFKTYKESIDWHLCFSYIIQNIPCLTFRTLIEFKLKIGAQIIIYIKIKIHKKKNCMFILVMIPISHTRLYLNIYFKPKMYKHALVINRKQL